MGYLDFVDLLLEEELGLREGRRFRTALKLSGLPHHKTLDEFDFAFQPDLDAPQGPRPRHPGVRRGAKANVALLGPPGVGKTQLAVALAVAACQAGYSIYFTSLDDLVRQLRAAEATGRFNRQLQTYLRPAVLVVDEVGYLPLDRAEANMVFQLVSRRYERGTMIMTSNKSLHRMGPVSSATTSSPPPSSTDSCTTATSSPSTAPATDSRTASPSSTEVNPCHDHHAETDTSGRTPTDT